MKARDVILQFISNLHFYTDDFHDNANVTNLTRNGETDEISVVQCFTDRAHKLDVGNIFSITGATTPINIGMVRTDGIGVINTTTKHDLTFKPSNPFTVGKTVTTKLTAGAVLLDPTFEGTFPVLQVNNRKKITVQMDPNDPDDTAELDPGSPADARLRILDASSIAGNFNGTFQVTNLISDTSFEYIQDFTGNKAALDPMGDIKVKGNPRISGAVDMESAIRAYTRQSQGDKWLFVVLNNVTSNNSRRFPIDAPYDIQGSNSIQQIVFQPVTVVVFFPTSQEIAGRDALDDAHNETWNSINRSILMKNFDSYTGQTTHGTYLNFVRHQLDSYTGSFMVYTYIYNLVTRLQFEDTVGYAEDIAFRDASLDLTTHFLESDQTEPFDGTHSDIDLDEEPL